MPPSTKVGGSSIASSVGLYEFLAQAGGWRVVATSDDRVNDTARVIGEGGMPAFSNPWDAMALHEKLVSLCKDAKGLMSGYYPMLSPTRKVTQLKGNERELCRCVFAGSRGPPLISIVTREATLSK